MPQDERGPDGRWQPGRSGNPAGPAARRHALDLPARWHELPRHERIGWLIEAAIAGDISPRDAGQLARLIDRGVARAGERAEAEAHRGRDALIRKIDAVAREIPLWERAAMHEQLAALARAGVEIDDFEGPAAAIYEQPAAPAAQPNTPDTPAEGVGRPRSIPATSSSDHDG